MTALLIFWTSFAVWNLGVVFAERLDGYEDPVHAMIWPLRLLLCFFDKPAEMLALPPGDTIP